MTVLSIEGLTHRYGTTQVLDAVSLTVEPGEVVALLGPSGCGKTTLLRAVAGLLTPSEGTIRFGTRTVAANGRLEVPIEKRGVGLVFQDYALFPTLTTVNNIGFGLRPANPARVSDLMTRLGLDGLADRLPAALSGGQQQRVALARALAPSPALLLLDEPFANVDAARRRAVGRSIRETLAAEGRAAILITHDREDALSMGHRVGVLEVTPSGGRLAQLDAPDVVYQRPSTAGVARLTGDGVACAGTRDGDVLTTPIGRFEVAGDGTTAVIRPHQVGFAPGEAGPAVIACAYRGHTWELTVALGDVEALVHHDTAVDLGTTGTLHAKTPLWTVPAD